MYPSSISRALSKHERRAKGSECRIPSLDRSRTPPHTFHDQLTLILKNCGCLVNLCPCTRGPTDLSACEKKWNGSACRGRSDSSHSVEQHVECTCVLILSIGISAVCIFSLQPEMRSRNVGLEVGARWRATSEIPGFLFAKRDPESVRATYEHRLKCRGF